MKQIKVVTKLLCQVLKIFLIVKVLGLKTNSGAGSLSFNVNQTTDTDADFIKSVNGINSPLELKITGDVNSFYDNASILADAVYSNKYDAGKDIYKLFSPDPDNVPNLFFVDDQRRELHRTCINNNQVC